MAKLIHKTQSVYAMVMAGGSGERFWPLSRTLRPKQCLSILGRGTMLQQACERLRPLAPAKDTFVLTRRGIEKLVGQQLPRLPKKNIIAEPCGRDTAACIALAACLTLRDDPQAIMVIVPADQLVDDPRPMMAVLKSAVELVRRENVLTVFGVVPTEPATGFGYIQAGDIFRNVGATNFYRVRRYHEKPNLQTAQKFLEAGDHWWNSGIFVWRASKIVEEIRRHLPDHGRMCEALSRARSEKDFWCVAEKLFPKLPKTSIDYGVLEKSDAVVTARAEFSWNDLGSWASLDQLLSDGSGDNLLLGAATVVEGKGNFVRSSADHLIGIIGVNDMVVVHTQDATLVCPKSRSQEIKKLLTAIQADPKKRKYV